MNGSTIAFTLLSPAAALALSPLFTGIVTRTKAFFAGRKGPPLFQPYLDLIRLFRKGTVYSMSTSWLFRAAPVIVFSTTAASTFFVPFAAQGKAVAFTGDLIILLYLLALARFLLVLSALDTGSAFEGMGASREAFFSALAEPVAFFCLLNVMRSAQTTSVVTALSIPQSDPINIILSALPLFIVLLAENARIPFDDPTTHLELTMIHEVMILDNSGPDLALLEYAAAIKLWLFALMVARIVLPIGLSLWADIALVFLVMTAIAMLVGTVESVIARARLLKVPQLLLGAGVITMLGLFVNTTGIL